MAHGLPPRFDPTVADSRYLAEGRQLVLSSFPVDVPVFPVNYDNCHLMNARNEALCRRAAGEEDQPLVRGCGGGSPRSLSDLPSEVWRNRCTHVADEGQFC